MRRVLSGIDEYIVRHGLEAEVNAPDAPPALGPVEEPTHLSLVDGGIKTIVWATGFSRSYPWLHVPVLDQQGEIIQRRGVTPVDGLYVLGQRFQHRRDSNFIDGVRHDAAIVADHIRGGALVGSAVQGGSAMLTLTVGGRPRLELVRSPHATSSCSPRSPVIATRCTTTTGRASASRFGGIIVQGGVTSGLLNAVVAEELPGPGSVFLHVDWQFLRPVRPGDVITARGRGARRARGQADHDAAHDHHEPGGHGRARWPSHRLPGASHLTNLDPGHDYEVAVHLSTPGDRARDLPLR